MQKKDKTQAIFIGDIVEANGKTIKENNMEIKHNIPLGTLVEVKFTKWHGNGACERITARLFIVKHGRDCDGTPLYWLSKRNWSHERRHRYVREVLERFFELQISESRACPETVMNIIDEPFEGGFSEESLTPIEVTEEIKEGYGALEHHKTPISLTEPVTEECTICGKEKEIRRHLKIYLTGSEGTLCCEDCYKPILLFARNLWMGKIWKEKNEMRKRKEELKSKMEEEDNGN